MTFKLGAIGLFQKKNKQCEWGHVFWNPPEIFRFFTLPLEAPDKIRVSPRNSTKLLHSLEILRSKTKSPGNSTWLFLDHTWKFCIILNYLENPLAISLIPLEIPYHQPPCFFFWNSPFQKKSKEQLRGGEEGDIGWGGWGDGISWEGYWRMSMWKFQGSIKKVKFPGVFKKNSLNFHGS